MTGTMTGRHRNALSCGSVPVGTLLCATLLEFGAALQAEGHRFARYSNGCRLFSDGPSNFTYAGPNPGPGKKFCSVNDAKLLARTTGATPTNLIKPPEGCDDVRSNTYFLCPVITGVTVDFECDGLANQSCREHDVPAGDKFC